MILKIFLAKVALLFDHLSNELLFITEIALSFSQERRETARFCGFGEIESKPQISED